MKANRSRRVYMTLVWGLSLLCLHANAQFKLFNWIRYNKASANNYYLNNLGLSMQSLTKASNAPDFDSIKSFASATLDKPVVTLDIETWSYAADSLQTTVARLGAAIDSFKTVNPASLVGYYGAIPQQRYEWANLNTPTRYNNWLKVNDSLKPAAEKVDLFFPSAYCRDTNTVYWRRYIDSNVAVIKSKYSTAKPIYVYICPQYIIGSDTAGAVDKQFIDPVRWKQLLNMIYDTADGAVIWTSNKDSLGSTIYWNDTMRWWTATKEFLLSKGLAAPFRMDSFSLSRQADTTHIEWTTSIDTTSLYFQVERSLDSISFLPVSDSIRSLHRGCAYTRYQFSDTATESQKVYYRIKIYFANDSAGYSGAIAAAAPLTYKSSGRGLVADLGSADNWLVNNGQGWTAALTPPGLAVAGLSRGSSIIISPGDVWANNIQAVRLPAGVSLVDSSIAGPGAFNMACPITTDPESNMVFSGTGTAQLIPSFAYFSGKAINANIIVDNAAGVKTSSPSTGAVSGTVNGKLILRKGVFTTNNGGGTFNFAGPAIQAEGGHIYANGYFTVAGKGIDYVLPTALFSNDKGAENHSVFNLNLNISAGNSLSVRGPLTVSNRLALTSGLLQLGGNLTINGAVASKPVTVTNGHVAAGMDTVIFNNTETQSIPAGFFQGDSVNKVEIEDTHCVNFGGDLVFGHAIIIGQLDTAVLPLVVSGRAIVNAGFVVRSIMNTPVAGESYRLLAADSIAGLPPDPVPVVLPGNAHYTARVEQEQDSLFLKIADNMTLASGLLDFYSTDRRAGPVLHWDIAALSGIQCFVLERSADGAHFKLVDTVAVNSPAPTAFTYQVMHGGPDKRYYRLKLVRADGSARYSRLLPITGVSAGFVYYPNPASDRLHIQGPVSRHILQGVIYDLAGTRMQSFLMNAGATAAVIDITAFRPGRYYILMTDAGHIVSRSSFSKL